MDFFSRLAATQESVGGNIDDIIWGTADGKRLRVGDMTDDHVANSRHYHKHFAQVAKVSSRLGINEDDCIFNQLLMEQVIYRRRAEGIWTIQDSDFRLE